MNTENIYATPEANLIETNDDTGVITSLYKFTTWYLIFLGTITLGVYGAHYIKRQNSIINQYLEDEDRLSTSAPNLILALAYISLCFTIFPLIASYFNVNDLSLIKLLKSVTGFIWAIWVITWSFNIRDKIHIILNSVSGEKSWLHGFWTFFFQIYYINYKINKLRKNEA